MSEVNVTQEMQELLSRLPKTDTLDDLFTFFEFFL